MRTGENQNKEVKQLRNHIIETENEIIKLDEYLKLLSDYIDEAHYINIL